MKTKVNKVNSFEDWLRSLPALVSLLIILLLAGLISGLYCYILSIILK